MRITNDPALSTSQATLPQTLHRVNGNDACMATIAAMIRVRGGTWFAGAPSHVAVELLTELERMGYFLGVRDRGAA